MGGFNSDVFYKSILTLGLCMTILVAVGCRGGNSDVAEVTGTLTIDGLPVEKALVTFYPTKGRASAAYTNADGVYELIYTVKQNGALIGEHKVTVKTSVRKEMNYSTGEVESEEGVAARKEMLPKKYRDRNASELTATVKQGDNTIDFALKTK